MMNLTVSIVNTSNWEFVQKCLTSLQAIDKSVITFETYVVDNCSTDGSVELIKQNYPDVKHLVNSCMLGFAANHNQVLRIARGRYILVLNDDTEVERHTLAEMVRFMNAHPQVGIATCKVILPSGEIQKICGRFPTFWGEFKTMTIDQIVPWTIGYTRWRMMYDFSYQEPLEVDWISGVFHMIRREVVEQIGVYDEVFPIYYEDTEYCHRLHNKTNYTIAYNPKVSILHYHGQTMIRKKTQNYRRFIFNVKSCIYYMKKHHGRIRGTLFHASLFIAHHILVVIAFLASVSTLFQARRVRNAFQKFRETVISYYQ